MIPMGKPKLFVINLSGNNLVYFSGSSVKGTVLLELPKPKEFKGISIVLSGKANIHWTRVYYGRNVYPGDRTEYSETEIILNDVFMQLWGNGRDSQELAAGRHEFPFNFHLGVRHLPTSFESQIGYIRYTLLAKIHRRQSRKLDHTTARAITVNETVSINDTPRLYHPQTQTKRRFNVTALVKTDRGGYCPGESIAISVEVENHNNSRITNVRATLMQVVVYNGTRYGHSREHCQIIGSIKYPGIEPGATSKWNDALLPIPARIYPTSSCCILKWSYFLTVALGNVLEVTIPITIGNVPFQAQGGQSGNHASQNLPSVQTAPHLPPAAANPYPPGIPPGETFNYSTAYPQFAPPPSYAEATAW